MSTESLNAAEARVLATKPTAPRISLADIEAQIAETYWFRASDAAMEEIIQQHGLPPAHPLDLLTICLIVCKNGYTVVGHSACVSPENFNAELGKKLAYEHAVEQLWPLMAFSLREKLHVEG